MARGRSGIGQFILVAVLVGIFGLASIFGYMMFANAEAGIDFSNMTAADNATYSATTNVVMFGLSFMQVIALVFVVGALFVGVMMLIKFR